MPKHLNNSLNTFEPFSKTHKIIKLLFHVIPVCYLTGLLARVVGTTFAINIDVFGIAFAWFQRKKKMPPHPELDLSGIIWPMCLLEFQRAFMGLKPKEMIEVLVQDPEVADQLVLIVEQSENKLIERRKKGETVHLFIQKDENP
jgi:TusA-related sulfurtransferase